MNTVKRKISKELDAYRCLLRNVPPTVMMFLAISTCLMNLLAQKELVNVSWLALDCGFLISWISFLCMDMLTKRFGAKAAIELSLTCVAITLLISIILYVCSKLGNNWSAYYTYSNDVVNSALNDTFGGTWYVIAGSMLAFAIASAVNAIINQGIGMHIKSNSFAAFAARSYVSTMVGQFVDNFVFATVVSKVFFGWTWKQVVFCSIAGAIAELLSEVVFSPIGYRVCNRWTKLKIGQEYLDTVGI